MVDRHYLVEHDPKYTILLVSGYNKPKTEPTPVQSHLCETHPIWTPWGWGIDRKRLVWLHDQLVYPQPNGLCPLLIATTGPLRGKPCCPLVTLAPYIGDMPMKTMTPYLPYARAAVSDCGCKTLIDGTP